MTVYLGKNKFMCNMGAILITEQTLPHGGKCGTDKVSVRVSAQTKFAGDDVSMYGQICGFYGYPLNFAKTIATPTDHNDPLNDQNDPNIVASQICG